MKELTDDEVAAMVKADEEMNREDNLTTPPDIQAMCQECRSKLSGLSASATLNRLRERKERLALLTTPKVDVK